MRSKDLETAETTTTDLVLLQLRLQRYLARADAILGPVPEEIRSLAGEFDEALAAHRTEADAATD